mmetsp:Transcript_21535/g.24543  ORF Transcript_21535/g.24543 Transcript_21535/m.24543 type:complete len:564 (+) Transcript_21535:149-1840(+)|eukprot:CAMPEP_0194146904 /NCGR_PEP_ID=MMETSP0152-20130528/22325_1 /TAXON_ID=1049557 /ORGANISM="Thalassiothrix antarctica, Strain L6-D1" /LENGTH=563 /DNA_ID=CAMNT_0038847559 /DNA_START=140 /DNA_END=1831 /DNA_ORIENTATION=+
MMQSRGNGGGGQGPRHGGVSDLNASAEIVSQHDARRVNVAAAMGLQAVLKTNLGPRGTLKMLVGGAGQIKLTKDGQVLLKEMQIQHPTALMIARTATAQDDVTGDGTTSTVLLCGELLRQADRYASEGLHPRILADGLDLARDEALKFLQRDAFTVKQEMDTELLTCIARTSLSTKLDPSIAPTLVEAVVQGIQCVRTDTDDIENAPMDLKRVEIITMERKLGTDSRFVNGLVLDHGGRHPNMPKLLKNCHVMTCNVTFEYEKTEINSGFYYSNAEDREKLVESERTWLDERCQKVVAFKRSACKEGESFVMINQKGIDPLSLDIFSKEGILCLRRAKRRNMERLTLACGGSPIHSLEDLQPEMLGFAGCVSEITLGEDKFTFVEDCGQNARSCTILLQGPNKHSLVQMQDAVHDGLRSCKNAIEDGALVPGAGAFEIAASQHLKNKFAPATKGRVKLGILAFAEALLVIPKTLAENSGLDVQETILKLEDESSEDMAVGLDVETGEPILPQEEGIWDNVRVKRQSLYLSTVLATQLLLVDEVMRAGRQMGKPVEGDPMDLNQ